jgi:hypothetical protein
MPRCNPPWSPEEIETAKKMRADKFTFLVIAERLGRTQWSVRARLDREAMTPEQLRARDRGNNARRSLRNRRPLDDHLHLAGPTPEMVAKLLDERDERCAVEPRDLTAILMGDPLPGYSALELPR